MHTSIVNKVISDFSTYDCLIGEEKIVKGEYKPFIIGAGSKKDWNWLDFELTHNNGMSGNLRTEQSKKTSKKYRIILFAKDFASEPLCRLDSDGKYHENINISKPLPERKISTPHFHQYDLNGISFAFKTDFLISHEKQVKESVQVGLNEMCNVYNIQTVKKSAPHIITSSGLFAILEQSTSDEEDLHNDINFPI